uniref:Amino acid transporter transmembrane domain-containing protein n=1 Tax=Setaria italica TaxID=4555 RepID=K3ZUH0_SETIT
MMAGGFLSLLAVSSTPPSARADINRVVYAVFAGAHARQPRQHHVVAWWFMPVNFGVAFLADGARSGEWPCSSSGHRHSSGGSSASCSAANFGNLLLVVIPAVCEQDGNPFGLAKKIPCVISYASFSMALGGVYIWTYTHSVMKRSGGEAYQPSPGCREQELVGEGERRHSPNDPGVNLASYHRRGHWLGNRNSAVAQLRSIFVGSNAPLRAVQDSLKLLGNHDIAPFLAWYCVLIEMIPVRCRDGTIPCLMLILGGNLTKVVAAIICVRYVILPLVGVAVVREARDMGFLPPDPLYQYTLMMHFAVPPAMSIASFLTNVYNLSQEQCLSCMMLGKRSARLFCCTWTYLVAALALTVWSTIFMWILQ